MHVLAELNGGWRVTAERMQAKARSLGARDTHVVSPDGYDAPGQVSSAYDLAVFGRVGLRNPDFARYCATVEARFPDGGTSSYPILNTNRLLSGAKGVKPYRGLIGIKNGYTSKAGSTLVAAARRDGRTLVVTVMNPQEGGGSAVRGGPFAARLGLQVGRQGRGGGLARRAGHARAGCHDDAARGRGVRV